MYTTLRNLALVRNLNLDLSDMACTCCNCGVSMAAETAYADTLGRIWCGDCVDGRIVSIYELAIHELTHYLDKLDIPYEEPEALYEGYAIRFPWCQGDVACHRALPGGTNGRLETYRFSLDNGDVHGNLLPLEALEIILNEWNKRNRAMRQEG